MQNTKSPGRQFGTVAFAMLCAATALPMNAGLAPNSNADPVVATSPGEKGGTPPAASPAAPALGVGCQGRISPKGRVRQVAAPADQGAPIIAGILAREGDEVGEGDVLAVLASEGPARLARAQASARVATATLGETSARADAALALSELELRRNEVRANLAAATAALEAVRAGAGRRQVPDGVILELEAALNAQTAALENLQSGKAAFTARVDAAVATATAQRKEAGNWGAGRIAEAALAEARAVRESSLREYAARESAAATAVAIARAQLESARSRNALPERTAGEVAAAEAQLSAARQRQAAMDAYAAAQKTSGEARIAIAKAELAEASEALRLADARLALTSVRSPIRGRVLRLHAHPGESPGAGGVIAEVADLSQMLVKAEVSVPDLPRVSVGANAEIEVSGWNARTFKGVVTKIGLCVTAGALADENPAAFKDLRVIPVEIEFDAKTSAILSCLTGAQVRVKIEARRNP
ncbi:MAG: HlyD family efflux transporter periplasmic adaptor subunit [Puniceicoccales bacterium]|jgi:HlyD family secretion protein|nr:HlyD family efflux transporter periplasmic adaptor subunit [Puniceicoccales bacterium]